MLTLLTFLREKRIDGENEKRVSVYLYVHFSDNLSKNILLCSFPSCSLVEKIERETERESKCSNIF